MTRSETSRMMLGFVVRQCALELGHPPDALELATWANGRHGDHGPYRVFGPSITVDEAILILRHPERLVTIHPHWQPRVVPRNTSEGAGKVVQFPLRRAR